MKKNVPQRGLISVIVPIYNVERFLEYTLNSIINQDVDSWELLLIDDGSKDRSGEICDKYASSDSRIRVFHIPNGGVSHARNVGIQNSRGEYIVFCDSDDLVAPDYFSTLKRRIESTGADVVRCGKCVIDEKTRNYRIGNRSLEWNVYEKNNLSLLPDYMYYVIWGKIYRKSLIVDNQLYFDEYLNRGEDTLFAYQTTLFCNRIVYSDNEYVNYRMRSNSLMHTNTTTPLFDQSVHVFYRMNDFSEGRLKNPKLWNHERDLTLFSVANNLIMSTVDKSLFKSNFLTFCADKSLREALMEISCDLPRRSRFAIILMYYLHTPSAILLIRILLKILRCI